MVAIVSGNSLGLSLSSLAVLGQKGQSGTAGQGRSGEQAYVNVATGNLVLQDRDDVLVGRGITVNTVRTYNSQGVLNDASNSSNWNVGAFGQSVVPSGTIATAGSTLTRTDRDGARAVYTWDAIRNLYVSATGAGAFNTIAYDGNTSSFTWTDGTSGVSERYQATGAGRLLSASDASGNTISYAYNANGTVQSVTDANGEVTFYDYDGTNLTQIREVTADKAMLTRVRYTYDSANRLSSVSVDLTPEDNSIADGKVYTTTYTYDGTSTRIASVTQSDGTSLSFTYVQSGGPGAPFKVASVTDALGQTTRFTYDSAANTTTVTDPLGAQSTWLYDAQGQLLQMRQGVTASNPTGLSQISYRYNAAGEVSGITDGQGHEVLYEYDANGNLLKEADSAGDVHTRTYNAANQLLTDTVYADASVSRGAFSKEAALPETTRYVYAQGNARQLRFVVSAQGNVTEYRYDSYGQRLTIVRYAGAPYTVSDPGTKDVPTEALMTAWAGKQDLTRTERTDSRYDARGALSGTTTYGEVDASGAGVATSAATTQYVYDQHGWLLKKIEPVTQGVAAAGSGTGDSTGGAVTTYIYDGLGRMLSVAAPSLDGKTPNTTVTSYDDVGGKTSVTTASGLVTVSAYDKAGRLVSVAQQTAGTGVLGTTSYTYDKDGNLLMTQDPTGVRNWMLYDGANRKIADIDATGALKEYVYDANGQLQQTIAYATKVDTARLIDSTGQPTAAWSAANTNTSLIALRPATTSQDQKGWRFYDSANRLAVQVDALGYVTQTTYDGASRILAVTRLANSIDVSQLDKGTDIGLLVNLITMGGVTVDVGGNDPMSLGTPVTLTAIVEDAGSSGMVTFYSGDNVLGTAMAINGRATLVTTRLPVGVNNIYASYPDNVTKSTIISPTLQKTITAATTTATLSFTDFNPGGANYWSPYPEVYSGHPLAISIALFAEQAQGIAAATGQVKFYNDGTLIGTATVINGVATLMTTGPSAGMSDIRVEYAGDATHAAVTATSSLSAKANSSNTTLGLTRNASSLTLSACVTTAPWAPALPGGTVTFYNDAGIVGAAKLVNGIASIQIANPASAATFRAVYSGDTNSAASNSPSRRSTEAVSSPASTIAQVMDTRLDFTSSRHQVPAGAPLTFSATVVPTSDNGGAQYPTLGGTVTFYSDGKAIGTADVIKGVAAFTTSGLPAGTTLITATYSGDANYKAALTSNTLLYQGVTTSIQRIVSTATSLVTSQADARYGSPLTLTATVVADIGSQAAPLGTVSFYNGNTLLGVVALVNGQSSLTLQSLPVGEHVNLNAVYSGDSSHAISGRGILQKISVAIASTTLTASTTSVSQGQSVTLTAHVTGGAPSGRVTFFAGMTILGAAPVVNGVATLVTSALPAGTSVLQAAYSGDANNSGSVITTGPTLHVAAGSNAVIAPVATTDIRLAPASDWMAGVGLTANLSYYVGPSKVADYKGGTFSVFDGETLLASCSSIVIDGMTLYSTNTGARVESILLPPMSVGTHTLKVVYVAGAGYPVSTNTIQQVIGATRTSVNLTSSRPQAPAGVPLTFTARIAPTSGTSGFSAPAFGGTVTFYSDGKAIGTAAVVNGAATFATSSLPVGATKITAAYSGDASSATSTSTSLNQQIVASPVASRIDLNTSPAACVFGSSLTLSASVLAQDGKNTPAESGTLSFYDGTTLLGNAAVTNGRAGLSVSNLSVGSHGIRIVYSGDASNATSQTSVNIAIAQVPSTLTNVTGASIARDDALSVQVSGVEPGGLVSFYSGMTLLGTAQVINGVATLSGVSAGGVPRALLPPGTTSYTAAYAGDANNASAKLEFTQTVAGSPVTTIQQDRTTTTLFNRDGQLQGELDAEGYLTEYKYNAAGEQIQTIRYANRAASFTSVSARLTAVAIARASSTLAGIRPEASNDDISTYAFYNARGQLVGQVDGEGYLTETTYDARDNVVQTRRYFNPAKNPTSTNATLATVRPDPHPQDQIVTQTWSAANQLTSRTNVEGTLTTFTYDIAGRLVQTTVAAGEADQRTSRQRYDIQGHLTGELDGQGSDAVDAGDPHADASALWSANGSTHTYDAAGRRTSTTDANGNRTLFFYDSVGRLSYTVNALGEVTESRYNALGQLSEQIAYSSRVDVTTLGATTPGGLNTATLAAQLARVADPARDSHTVHTYNATGTEASIAKAISATSSSTTSFSYNAFREAIASSQTRLDDQIITNTVAYDRRGQQVSTTQDSTGVAVTRGISYDAFGRPNTRTDANGNVSTLRYDRLGRLVTTTDANGATRTTTYDAFDRVLTQRDALNNVTTYAYDTAGRSVTMTTPEGIVATTVHTRHGQTQNVTDGRGNTVIYYYDRSGNLRQTRAADGTSTYAAYDRTGLKLSISDARGTVTSYSYDAAGRLLTRIVDPGGLALTTRYQYDAKGQTISVSDPLGVVTSTEFDLAGQTVRQTVDPSTSTHTGLNLQTVYTHDTDGSTLSVAAPDGRLTRYTYDGAGRRIKEQVDPLGLNLTRSYTYDAEGNVIKAIDAAGNTTLYIYDKANRVAFTIDPMGGVQQNGYDAQGRLTSQTTYAAFVPVATWNGVAPSLSAMQTLLPTLGLATTQSRRYDGDGRLHFTVDATGGVVKYTYDGAGNLVETWAYAQRIDLAGWNGAGDPPVVADAAHDQHTRSVYDALGRKTWTIDGTGAVVRQVFDASGNVSERVAFSTRVPVATMATASALAAAVALVADATRDLHETYVYDRAGRQTSRTDGVGALTTQTYDADGNVINRTDANNQVTRYAYDSAGYLIFTLGPLGQLEKNSYDSAGRVTQTTRYAQAVNLQGLGATPSLGQLQALIVVSPGQDQQQYRVYDRSGRLSATVDALGDVVTFVRDGNGNVTERTAWANPIDMTSWAPGTPPSVKADPAHDQRTRTFYDAMGRETLAVDALGYAVQHQYNALGQLTYLVRYPVAVTAATPNAQQAQLDAAVQLASVSGQPLQITAYDYDATGNRTRQIQAFGQPEAATTQYVYDGLGQLTRTIDPRGIELSQSDSQWALTQRQQLKYVNAAGGALKASDLSPAQRQELAARYTTTTDYDAAGHKLSVTDALGGVTRSAYDASGHVVQITDPRGNAAFYYFDAAGRVTLAVDPEGYATATSYDALGHTLSVKRYFNRVSGGSGTQPPALPGSNPSDALTRFEYDAAGRLTRTVDAESNAESYTWNALGQRATLVNKLGGVTAYTYDRLGRVNSETLPVTSQNASGQPVAVVNQSVYDAFGNKITTIEAAGLPEQRITQFTYDGLNRQIEQRQAQVQIYVDGKGWSTVTPTRTSTYDANGNLIAVVDPNGNRTRTWFDASNRKVAEVSATGTLSQWTYDAAGNVMAQRVYGDVLTLPVSDASPAPLNATNVRLTTFAVDANNRVLSSTIAGVQYGEYNAQTAQYTMGTRDVIQKSAYDANGNVVRKEDGKNAVTLAWFDKLGQKVLEVDPMGYGVRWERDANGAVLRETRYLQSVDLGSLSESTPVDTVLARFKPSTGDQITEYSYDRNARVLSESRLNVANGSVAANGTLSEGSASAIKRTEYDALGDKTATIDAQGQRSDMRYDALGRLLDARRPGAIDFNGASVRQTTDYEYDGLGNVRREIHRGAGGAADQIVRYGYDTTGVRTSMVSAKGETTTNGHDANGNTTAQITDRADADGTLSHDIVSIAYDGVNREVRRFTGTRDAANMPVFDVANTVTLGYNAWGELASKRTGSGDATGAAQEYYDYDKAGHLWRTNSQGGVNKAWLYDMAGNATLQLESQRVNLRAMTWEQMTGDGSKPNPDILITITAYDRDNRAVSVVQPKMDASRPNLVMFATELNVDSGQYGGLDIAVAPTLASPGSTAILAPSDTSNTGTVGVAGAVSFQPVATFYYGGSVTWHGIALNSLAFGSKAWADAVEAIYGTITAWRVNIHTPMIDDRYPAFDTGTPGNDFNYVVSGGPNWPKTITGRADPYLGSFLGSISYLRSHPTNIPVTLFAVTASGKEVAIASTALGDLLGKMVPPDVVPSHEDRSVPPPVKVTGASTPASTAVSGTFMRLTAGEARDSDTIQLYNRPLGSNGPYTQSLPVFKAGLGGSSLNNVAMDGWYMTRLESLGGPTELLLVVTQADGKVVRRESITWDPTTRQSTSYVAPARPVFTSDNVAHFTGLNIQGSAIRVRQRPLGSQGPYSDATYWPVANAAGRFDVGFAAGASDVIIEVLDTGRGVIVDRLKGVVDPGASRYEMGSVAALPSTVTFRDIPTNAASLRIEYEPLTPGGASGAIEIPRAASGGIAEWVWDASNLVPDKGNRYGYRLHFVARDADGFVLTDATGEVTIGAVVEGTSARLTGNVKHQVLSFDPGIPGGQTLKLRYRVKGATTQDFIEVTATRSLVNSTFKWDATASQLDPTKEYEFLYDVYNAAGAVIGNGQGYFRPNNDSANDGSNINARWGIPNLPGGPIIPGQPAIINNNWLIQRRETYDALGHIVSEIDGNGNVTDLSYNTLGLLTDKIGPAVDITLANGQVQNIRPTEHYSYDLNGQQVGKRDANGNQSTVQINAAGQTVAEWHPGAAAGSQAVVRKTYDVFGNLRSVTDEIGRETDNSYDANNRLIRVDRPINADGSRAFDTYEYDILGERIAHANALNFRDRTYYDAMGRVTRYVSAEGATVNYGYTYDNTIGSAGGINTGGWVDTTTDANGRVQTLKNDVFGRTMWKQDLGGHQFTYAYNWSGLIATQTGTSGQNITYSYYDNGYLRKTVDLGVSTESTFEYDNNGNRIFEGFKSTASDASMVFQWSRVSYDAYNRVKTIDDPRYTINYEYDANGNRRRVKSTYINVVDNSKAVQDYWYAYDGMNRFTTTMGQLVNGQIVRGASGDGVSIEYDDAGQRKAATYAATASNPSHREDYAYDGAGNMTTTTIDGVLASRRTNDLAGRVTRYEEWNTDQTLKVRKDRTWNRDNQLTQEVERRPDPGTKGQSGQQSTTTYSLMKDGTLSGVETVSNSFKSLNSAGEPNLESSSTHTITSYAYAWWDSAKQTKITLDSRSTGYAANSQPPGYSVFSYDVNGHLSTATDLNPQTPRTFSYWTNAEGQVLQRQELLGGKIAADGSVSGATKSRDHRYFYFDGKRVGNVGNDGTEREDYAQQLAQVGANDSPDTKYRKFTPTNAADFDENYQPVNASFPGPAPGSYTVRAGDTLESIARAQWGDATLWYLLADANGLEGQPSAPLVANTVLQVPNRVTNVHNTSQTFRPYDPGKAMGDTNPTRPDPLPPPGGGHGGCGGIGMIIAAVVAAVATVYTAGAAGVLFGATGAAGAGGFAGGLAVLGSVGGLTMPVLGAAVVGGAVGAVAGQVAGMTLGVQNSFNWSGVALGAIGAGVTAGVGAELNVPGGWLAGAEKGVTAARLAIGNGATQGLGIVTGLQKGFDWRGVAASAASGYVSAWAGSKFPDMDPFRLHLADGMAGGIVSAAVRGGSIGQALPGIVGDTVGNMVANRIVDTPASASTLYGPGGDVNGMVQAAYPVDPGMQFAWSANAQFNPGSTFDATAASLGRTTEAAHRLMTEDNGASIVGPSISPDVIGHAVPYPQISVSPLPELAPLGTVRNLDGVESFLAFNPAGQFLEGAYDRGAAMVGGVWNAVSHPLDTAAAIGGHYANAYGTGRLGDTILGDVGGAATGFIRSLPPLAAVNALYRQDEAGAAYQAGGAAFDAALFAGPDVAGATVQAGASALRSGAVMFGPQLDRLIERTIPALRTYVVPEGPSLAPVNSKFTVGTYRDIRGTLPGFDAHHVGQKALMSELIPDYDPMTAPAILVPKVGHTIRGPNGIVSRNVEGLTTPRDVLARDVFELRRVYPDIANSQLQELIRMNRNAYPNAFAKSGE